MPKIIYVSHPFGGNCENTIDTRNICRRLAKQLPEALFLPGLSVPCRAYSKKHYSRDLALLLELELRCDVIYMTGKWEASTGCMAEYEFAKRNGIPVAESYAELLAILVSMDKEELN